MTRQVDKGDLQSFQVIAVVLKADVKNQISAFCDFADPDDAMGSYRVYFNHLEEAKRILECACNAEEYGLQQRMEVISSCIDGMIRLVKHCDDNSLRHVRELGDEDMGIFCDLRSTLSVTLHFLTKEQRRLLACVRSA